MDYRLGLDLGTASIGLVCYELGAKGEPLGVCYHAVRIFSEPLEPSKKQDGVGEPKKAARRVARLARRQHSRRARRLRKLAHLAVLLGLDPTKITADKGQKIHAIRAKAARTKIPLEELLRVFLKVSKRRGYSGGFRIKSEGSEKGRVETGISELQKHMESAGADTLGVYLLHRYNAGQTLKLKEVGLYASRELLEEEFEKIWTEQSKHHPGLKDTKKTFFEAIFYQRPLKTVAPMVGHCPLEPSLRRAPMAQPAAQNFRIEKQIADLRWGVGRSTSPLKNPQKEVIRGLLQQKAEVKFEQIYKALYEAGCSKPTGKWLNLSQGGREILTGNKSTTALRRLKLLPEWKTLSAGDQARVINLLADMGSPEVFDQPDWDSQLTGDNGARRTLPTTVVDFINKMVDTGKFDRLSKMGFDTGRSAYSIKVLKALAQIMHDDGIDEDGAVSKQYPHHGKDRVSGQAELSPHPSTKNTVVDVALRQVRREVNTAIRVLGCQPKEVIVELNREMAAGKKRREQINKSMRLNETARREAKKKIEEYGGPATASGIRRYLLWTEQDQQWCPYCDRTISLAQALNGGETQSEHILPRSLTRVGMQRDFLVIAHRSCNDDKEDRTPWEAWGDGRDPDRWKIVEKRADQFKKKKLLGKAQQLLGRQHEGEVLDAEAISDFTARQFSESAWISKLTAQWLRSVCPDVFVGRGYFTAYFRRIWGLETVIPEARYKEKLPVRDTDKPGKNKLGREISEKDFNTYKSYWEWRSSTPRTDRKIDKRIDHRHHLIDALVIGLGSRSLYQQLARHYKDVTESKTGKKQHRFRIKPPVKGLRRQALALVQNVNLTHRPDRWPAGPFFLDKPLSVKQIDGTESYCQRVRLKDLAKTNDEADRVRNRIQTIVSEYTRGIVSKAFEARIKSGMTPTEALAKDIKFPGFDTMIGRVKVKIKGDVSKGVKVEHSQRDGTRLYKWLKPDGKNAYDRLELDLTAPDKPQTKLVLLHEAAKSGLKVPSPSVIVFRKSDTVRDTKDGKFYVVRKIVAKGPGLYLSLHTESVNVDELKASTGQRIVTGSQLGRLEPVSDV